MNHIGNALATFGLAMAIAGLVGCEPTQNPYGTGASKGAQLGNSSFDSSSSSRPSPAGTVAGGTIDSPQSQGLSDYLKHHSLPLVGAQVVTSPSGGKQVILFGFVASDFGKTDAEQKARHYLSDPNLVVDNRIKVSGELARGGKSSGSTVNGVPSGNAYDSTDPYASPGSAQDNLPPDAQAYAAQGQQLQQMQQYQQYNSGGSGSMLTMILPLLMGGGGGLSMGGGGYGGGYGGFGSGYAPGYGGYGYPSYPPPMPNSFGSSAGGFSF
ncbi:MAG TPA: hypothetical protein VGR40_07600 [Candidatus Binatus sp.]|nr:hypothetical protein [Candidatus Binatus sp.]